MFCQLPKTKMKQDHSIQNIFRFLPNLQRLYKIIKSVKSINLKKKLIKIEKKNKNCNKK